MPTEPKISDEVYKIAAKAMVPWSDDDGHDIFEWHHCADQPNCRGASEPCPCSGMPWPSEPVRAAVEAAYRAGREDAQQAIDLLADLVVKCTEYGTQDGDFVANYLLPTGPVHRAIPWLDQRGINVRPGFDGRTR